MSFVYVIGPQEENICKIGFSDDPSRRLRQLQTGHSKRLLIHHQEEVDEEFVRQVERAVHKNIKHLRHHGEWFGLPPAQAILEVKFAIIDLSLN